VRIALVLLLVLQAASCIARLAYALVQHNYLRAAALFFVCEILVVFIYYLNRRNVQRAFGSQSTWPATLKALILAVFTVLLAFPFYWMVIATFKQNLDLYTVENNPFIFNAKPTLDNLRLLFETRFVRWLMNTAEVGVMVVAITLLLAVPAAYALARLTGRWGQRLGIAIFLTYLVPSTLLFIPLSRVVAMLGLQDSIWALVLVYPSFTIPFSIWLLMGFFKSIPKELEDAAMVDGLTRFGAFVKMVIPVSISGILTVVIFTFTLVTQEFVYALTFISSDSKQMVGVGIPIFLVRGDVYFWGSLMAACLIASLPIAFLYNLFLDRFIAGFTVGAVKG
jgi:multiple sugar transport system permease protein